MRNHHASRRNIIQEFGNLLDEIHFAYMFVLPAHIFKDVCMADIVLIASRCIMDYPLTIPNRHTFDAFKETLVLEFFSIEKIERQNIVCTVNTQNYFYV